MINATESGNLTNQHIQQIRFQTEGIILNHRLISQDDQLGSLRIRGQQSPVNKSPIPQVWIIALLGRKIQHALYHILGLLGILEEAFDRRRKELQLHRRVFFLKRFKEGIKEFIGIVNTLGILSNNPNHGRLCLWFIQRIEIVAQSGNDGLISIGITTEDVLNNDYGLLDDIVHLRLDEFQ